MCLFFIPRITGNIQYLSFVSDLLSIMTSRFIHSMAFPSFLRVNISLYVCVYHFVYLLLDTRLFSSFGSSELCCHEHRCTNICSKPCFQLLWVYNLIQESGIPGSCGDSMFNFLRNVNTLFHSGYTILHSHQ